jgi:hypothetical protein
MNGKLMQKKLMLHFLDKYGTLLQCSFPNRSFLAASGGGGNRDTMTLFYVSREI